MIRRVCCVALRLVLRVFFRRIQISGRGSHSGAEPGHLRPEPSRQRPRGSALPALLRSANRLLSREGAPLPDAPSWAFSFAPSARSPSIAGRIRAATSGATARLLRGPGRCSGAAECSRSSPKGHRTTSEAPRPENRRGAHRARGCGVPRDSGSSRPSSTTRGRSGFELGPARVREPLPVTPSPWTSGASRRGRRRAS